MIHDRLEMILLDLDGTLLNSDSILPEKNKQVVKELITKDYKVAIATGRTYQEAKDLTDDILNLAYITTNGSHIKDFEGEVIYNKTIDQKLAISILDILNDYPSLVTAVSLNHGVLLENTNKFVEIIFSNIENDKLKQLSKEELAAEKDRLMKYLKDVNNFNSYIKNNKVEIQKIFTLGEEDDNLDPIKNRLKKEFGSAVKISNSGANNLEINANNVSKGKALKILADRFNVSLENTIAFGDSNNDLEMFKTAGIAIAMGNSKCDYLKERADMITDSNDNHGVAKVLSKLLG